MVRHDGLVGPHIHGVQAPCSKRPAGSDEKQTQFRARILGWRARCFCAFIPHSHSVHSTISFCSHIFSRHTRWDFFFFFAFSHTPPSQFILKLHLPVHLVTIYSSPLIPCRPSRCFCYIGVTNRLFFRSIVQQLQPQFCFRALSPCTTLHTQTVAGMARRSYPDLLSSFLSC